MPRNKYCNSELEIRRHTSLPDGVEFLLWAPKSSFGSQCISAAADELVPMKPLAQGYHRATIPNMKAGRGI